MSSTMPPLVRAGRGDHREHSIVRGDRRPGGPPGEVTARVLLDQDHLGIHHPRGGDDRGVGIVGADDGARSIARRAWSGRTSAPRPGRRDVAELPAGHETAARRLRPAEQLDQPAERLVLGEDRPGARLPGAGEDVEAAHRGVEGPCRDGRRTGNVREIQRVVLCPGRRREDVLEDPQGLGRTESAGGDRGTHLGGELRCRSSGRLRVGGTRDPPGGRRNGGPGDLRLVTPDLGDRPGRGDLLSITHR